MDERHWWIAGKIQETFHIGGFDNPTLLEDFMCEEETLDMINQFLNEGGPCRLFFYTEKPESGQLSTRELHCIDSLASMKSVDLENISVLYFLRHSVDREVDPLHMERDVFCGELKNNTIENLTSMLSDIFIPALKNQKDWGQCTSDSQMQLMYNMEKFQSSLQETNANAHAHKQLMLKQPENIVNNDFKQHRLAALDTQIISEYEGLLSDWISTIEAVLMDTSDERFMDPNAGPLSELDRWRRRQRLLTSITEQLKSKECKAVIGVLITAKSRLLKKWKTIDAGITDAMNETKDKVKYMESLKRHLDQLYQGATPSSIMSVALPGLTNSVKQMDSISRFYARGGFLGLLFTKITNQLVLVCKDYVKDATINTDDEDHLWEKVDEEIESRDALQNIDPHHRHMRFQVENKLKGGKKKSKDSKTEETLYQRLRACLTLQTTYRDMLRSMRDSLGATNMLSHFHSMSSLVPSVQGSKQGPKVSTPGTGMSSTHSKKGSVAGDHSGHGVSIADEDIILHHMDSFCGRIRQIMDVVNTLSQYTRVIKSTNGLPRPRKEDLIYDEALDFTREKKIIEEPPEMDDDLPLPSIGPRPSDRETSNLVPITEDEELRVAALPGEEDMEADGKSDTMSAADEPPDLFGSQQGLTREEVAILKKYYDEDNPGEGPSVAEIIKESLQNMRGSMAENVTTKTMMDVETKDRERYEETYTNFLMLVQDLEKFLASYLHAIFTRKMKTSEALELITRFTPIGSRPGVRAAIAEKFVEIFNWYEGDLEEVHHVYEKYKDEPQKLRNAPPVAGSIYWSRQLLKRIEEPMKVFRDNRAVSSLKDFSRIVKIYNRLATALVTFESLWFSQWKQHIEIAKRGMQATLFIQHPSSKQILVNADERVLELIQEAKWLKRLGIAIPDSAEQVLAQEQRFKQYKNHLELVLKEYKDVCDSVPESLKALFKPHADAVLQHFQPGLSTLAWNSMNIDAFLHQIHSATTKLRLLVEHINDVMTTKIEGTVVKIASMILFDYDLAFHRSWPPHEFTACILETVEKKSKLLYQYVEVMEKGMLEITNTLTNRKGEGVMLPSQEKEKARNKKSRQLSAEENDRLIAQFKQEEKLVEDLTVHYCTQLYNAILTATTRTLVTLAEASGCELLGEVERVASALSEARSFGEMSDPGGQTSRPVSVMSGISGEQRPSSVLSMLSTMTWSTEKAQEITFLQFEVLVKFSIPNIILEPELNSIQTAVTEVASAVMEVSKNVTWLEGQNKGETFYQGLSEDESTKELLQSLHNVVEELQPIVQQHLHHFSLYDFLWKDDMHGDFYEFINHDPGLVAIQREVERLLRIEKKVMRIPLVLPVGSICLQTSPVKDALHGFAMAWKTQYASVLHEEAKKKLDAALLYRSNVRQRLELHVSTLDQLNSTLHLLEELRDMENKIDEIYLPIETMYANLREFELRLPRQEVEEVDGLRDRWQDLLELADECRHTLLKERRGAFEQELDKQVKTFVVEVIQFRNAFDAQGPAIPGIPPSEAVARLHNFQNRYTLYDSKRRTLDSVSRLFGIPCKPFPELDRTGEELVLLGLLYGLFQKFIRFDSLFRDTLWAEVDLEAATKEVESYWDECLALPSKLKDWDAYNEMKNAMQQYLDVFPLLHKLASKEIRNRHWLQVMQVTGTSFHLEANVFKLCHLLDIGLLKHKPEIEEIARCASREQELEIKMRITEEEWTEQVLQFEPYKKRGPIYLDKAFTERLLEQLEDAQALLAQMLTSRYIGPLREEAASWAEKLKEVAQVLEQWVEVQDLWQYLEAVFSNPSTAKELPQEAKRYGRIDKGWTKLMKRMYDTRNVLQCCYGGEVPKGVVLRHIYEELEICFKSLMGYLDNKRRSFPRFYFVSDPILLAILSHPNDLESVKPHLRSIFTSVTDVTLVKSAMYNSQETLDDRYVRTGGRTMTHTPGDHSPGLLSSHGPSATPPRIDKRLMMIHNINAPSPSHPMSTMLPSEGALEEVDKNEATEIHSIEGEVLTLEENIPLKDGVEVWLSKLKECITSTLHTQIKQIITDVNLNSPVEDWAYKYPSQVCKMGLLYLWTKECEAGVAEIKYDRKSIPNTLRRFGSQVSRLPSVITRGAWKNFEDTMLPIHRLRLEIVLTQSIFLKDVLDNMCNRKLREPTDFDWRRNVRCYLHNVDGQQEPLLYILDSSYKYGCEFYGAQPGIAITPQSERSFLSMNHAISSCRGAALVGQTGVGKTETVKGMGQMFGMHLGVFQSSPYSNPTSVGRLLQGMSMDGCWGLLDDFQLMGREALSVFLDHSQAILGALRSRSKYCYLGEGQEISVSPKTAMFMTVNPGTPVRSYTLPNEVKSLFRTISLLKPDYSSILKAKCSSYGFKASGLLGLRLKIVSDLAKDQLPREFHNQFSVAAMNGVLRKASLKKKNIKEDRSMIDKLEKEKTTGSLKEDGSRSNSQASLQPPTNQSAANLISPIQSGSRTQQPARKTTTPNPMSAAAKTEHAIVGQTLKEIIGPRLFGESLNIFRHIVRDIFYGLPEPPTTNTAASARTRKFDVEAALEQTASENNLVAHKLWLDKCMQLYNVSQVHHGIILAGPPGSGKSTCLQMLVDALCVTPRGLSRHSHRSGTTNPAENNHKLQRVNPLVVDDLSLMFGYLNQNNDWVDGIFTNMWKKANRNLSTTWLCLDGPLNASWADNFSSVMDGGKVLNLKNGDHLFLSDNVNLVFETDTLTLASPATIARCGIVFMDKNVVGWRPIAKAWLGNRTQQEVHVLQRAFDKTVEVLSHFVIHEARPRLKLNEVGMFKTCIDLLSAMLSDNVEIGGEMHIERLYLFCLIWSFGGLLEEKDIKGFSDLLKTLSTALPDDDRDICVFDYYVDESGEWDPWQSRVPENQFSDDSSFLGDVFVDTIDTIRTRILMEFACASKQHILLVGPPGAGKTVMINDFLDSQDSQSVVTKRLVFSGSSNAKQLQTYVESNIYHRQGFVYGGKDSKKLNLFIDDLNMPSTDTDGVQRCNELLRQVMDNNMLCTLQRPFEWKTIEGLTVFSAIGINENPSVTNRTLDDRLLRHFAVLCLPAPRDEGLKCIVNGVLEATMLQSGSSGLDIDLHNSIVSASCTLLNTVQKILRPSPMPGRHHYLYTLRDIVNCFMCLRRLPDESRAEHTMVISLWKHEMSHILRDRLCRYNDQLWFDDNLNNIISDTWPDLEPEQIHQYFVTFPIDARVYQRPVTSISYKQIKVVLQPVDTLKEVHNCLNTHLTRYNEEFGNVQLDLMLSDYVISHIIRMHRVLSFHHQGNILLIGALGSKLSTLCKLALHVADCPIHDVDCSKQNTFFDGLRSALRLSGSEGKVKTLLFTARDLQDEIYLDAINSLLVCGEYPHLFTNDEMDGLLQAIIPAMKRDHPSLSDPMKFFVSRVKMNLHIILCLPPSHRLIKNAASYYPGLLTGCQVDWMCDWPQESLLGEANYYVLKHNLTQDIEALGEHITTCLANIHSFILRDCKQMPWAGDLADEVSITQVKVIDKKKDILKTTNLKVRNMPYSKHMLLEHIKLRHKRDDIPGKNEVFIGPNTYKRCLDCFRYLYTVKSKERTEKVNKLLKVISTLDQTREDANVMKKHMREVKVKFENSCVKVTGLLDELTGKATLLEKLKARVGESTSLSAFLQLNELSSDEEEDDALLGEEEADEYDEEFEKMREANLKTRITQAIEEKTEAEKRVEAARVKLGYQRQQVEHWQKKVDRSTIERLKNFKDPPIMVGHIMEMIMTLIGKRKIDNVKEPKETNTKEEMSGRMSASSSSIQLTKKQSKTVNTNERVDRNTWKAMQITMADSQKFVDMMHNVPWEDGLSKNVIAAIESFLAKSKDGQLGVTGEGSLLEDAKDTSFQAKRRSPSNLDNPKGITIAAAKYSSEDAVTLVQYTIAIVEYSRFCGPLKTALEKLHELEREIEENERMQKDRDERSSAGGHQSATDEADIDDEELDEDQLPKIQSEVDALQAQFDAAVVEKHSLELELQSMNDRLKAATDVIESMRQQELLWRQHCKEYDCNEVLLANCIAAAAFLTYCGSMNTDVRQRMGEFFMFVCEHHGVPLAKKQLFRNMDLVEFLYSPIHIKELELLRLPQTRLLLENACFVMQEESCSAWPLICDPASRIIDWLQYFLKGKGLVEVRYHEIRSQLETCLSDGVPLLVTDCDPALLCKDERFREVIASRNKFIHGKTPFKLWVGDHEVECEPSFRMYLHTTHQPHTLPPELAARLAVTYFLESRYDLEEELLDRFMAKEKSRLDDEKSTYLMEKLENMKFLEKIEGAMADLLSSDVRLMNNLTATKKLAELKKQFDETVESQGRVEANEGSILRAREGFRSIAQRGAVCFDTMMYLSEISPLYQTSYQYCLRIYDGCISHSERSAVKAVVERMTVNCYALTSKGLSESDRTIYSMMLAIEIEDSLGNVGPGEREYLISPQYGAVSMTAMGINQTVEPRITQAKKLFDWMTDEQFHHLQLLAIHFEWFQDMFDRMPRDGRETQWRNICEHDHPEHYPLPDKMDDSYTPLQRFMVIRSVRPDKLLQATTVFVSAVLGKRFIGESAIDLGILWKHSCPKIPLLLLYNHEPENPERLFQDLASKKGVRTMQVAFTASGHNEEKLAKKYLRKAMADGLWVLLHNAHNAIHLVNALESMFNEAEQIDSSFRCFLSAEAKSPLPERVLQNSIKINVDSPKAMKDNLIRAFSAMDMDMIKQSSRPEWAALLHNIVYLHGALKLRARFTSGGWNNYEDFNQFGGNELMEALSIATGECKDNLQAVAADGSLVVRTTSWMGIRYMLSEVIYGSYVTDVTDQNSISAMIDYWMSPAAVKRDFELPKLKYKHPGPFTSHNPRLALMLQALENLPNHFLDVPEAANLHHSVETLIGEDQYVFTRLNKIYDAMPSSKTLSHKLFPRPPTPFLGSPLCNISTTNSNLQVVDRGVFAGASYASTKMKKEQELWEICHTMIPKVPRAYSKDYVTERIKKIGGYSIFNLYIIRELELMYKLLTEIKTTLQAIKAACEVNTLGDQLSPRIVAAADDLYYNRIPKRWCELAGDTAPPLNWGLAVWLQDLQARCQHFERILVSGREKMPAYWLGAFFHPRGLLALLKQEAHRSYARQDRTGNIEQFVFQTEITSRDKDHLRDPPQEGMFVFGLFMWGCSWEKTTGELQDSAPRHACTALPVIHVTCWPQHDKPIIQDPARALEIYQCPVYQSRISQREPIMEVDVRHENVASSRWALRGLSATVRPY
ncbi:unnamed protein product [Owenia fusiformis]|uniref:AAA+ ATPase domain-containing protein n=1 Tax=Owenia fusiformis TaxID=6347 RepID=A0A8S4Q5E5_OWEFU|nr:unnamed protein product [Owenia fusiformis]